MLYSFCMPVNHRPVQLPMTLHRRLVLLQACRTIEGTKVSLAATIEWLLDQEVVLRRKAGTWPKQETKP